MSDLTRQQQREIRHLVVETVNARLEGDLKHYSESIKALQESDGSQNNILDRFSLLIVGGSPGFKGLTARVEELEGIQKASQIEELKRHAKLAGVWATITIVVVPLTTILVKLIWHIDIPTK